MTLSDAYFAPVWITTQQEHLRKLEQNSPPLRWSSVNMKFHDYYRTLSRRLDRCDRIIQDEVGDSNGGNV